VALKPDPWGNGNAFMRADGKFKGVSPQQFVDYLLNPTNLPGLQEWVDVAENADGSLIKYCKVKAPMMTARDHCWKVMVDRRDDGSIFVCIRTTEPSHPECMVSEETGCCGPAVIRAYYYNGSLFRMSEEDGVMEMTEFIWQDLKGGIPVCLMNAALPAGTVDFNKNEMKLLKNM